MPTATQRLVSALFGDAQEEEFPLLGAVAPSAGGVPDRPTPLIPERPGAGQMFLTDETLAQQQAHDSQFGGMEQPASDRPLPGRVPSPGQALSGIRSALSTAPDILAPIGNLADSLVTGRITEPFRAGKEYLLGEGQPSITESRERVRPKRPSSEGIASIPDGVIGEGQFEGFGAGVDGLLGTQEPGFGEEGLISFTDPSDRDIIQRPGENVRGAMQRGEEGLTGPRAGDPGTRTLRAGERGLQPGQSVTLPETTLAQQQEAARMENLRAAGPMVAQERVDARQAEISAGESFDQWGGLTGPGGMDERRRMGQGGREGGAGTMSRSEAADVVRAQGGRAGVGATRAVQGEAQRQADVRGETQDFQREQQDVSAEQRVEVSRRIQEHQRQADVQGEGFRATGYTVQIGDMEVPVVQTGPNQVQVLQPQGTDESDTAQTKNMKAVETQVGRLQDLLNEGNFGQAQAVAQSLGMKDPFTQQPMGIPELIRLYQTTSQSPHGQSFDAYDG